MTKKALILLLLLSLLGCAQEVPLSKRDHAFAVRDIELERQKYNTFAGTKEREAIDEQIRDHNTDHSKFYLVDGINLGSNAEGTPVPPLTNDETDRIKKINDVIDRQLHRTQ